MKQKLKNYRAMMSSCDGRIFRQGFWVLADQCGYSVISFVMGILLARACSKEMYGGFVLMMTLVFFSKVVQRSLVTVPFSVLYPRCETDGQGRYLSNSVMQHFVVTALLMGLVGVATFAFSPFEDSSDSTGLGGLFLLLVLSSLSADFMRTVLITQLKYRLCLGISVVIQAGIIISLIWCYAAGWLNVALACWILCGGYGLFVLGGVLGAGVRLDMSGGHWADMQKNFKQGKWILSSTLVNYVGLQFLPWITLIWWDKAVVATVGVLSVLTCVMRPLLQAIVHYLTPRLSEMLKESGIMRVRMQTLLAVHVLGLISLCFTIGICFAGDWLICRIYGSEYSGYQWALVLFSVAAGLRMMNAPLRAMMTAVEQADCLVKSSLAASVVSLAMAFLLIPAYAVEGIALVHAIYNLVVFSVNCLKAFRQGAVCSIQTQVVTS